MKAYTKPSVAKVNFDYTDRVAASLCFPTFADAEQHAQEKHLLADGGVGGLNDGCTYNYDNGAYNVPNYLGSYKGAT